jgi:hypothetical protein
MATAELLGFGYLTPREGYPALFFGHINTMETLEGRLPGA